MVNEVIKNDVKKGEVTYSEDKSAELFGELTQQDVEMLKNNRGRIVKLVFGKNTVVGKLIQIDKYGWMQLYVSDNFGVGIQRIKMAKVSSYIIYEKTR